MEKSPHVQAVEAIQKALRPFMKRHGFKVRGRTYNRLTNDGLTQVINFQMGRFDPPGTTYIPGLRENLYGLFTINLGVYVPEVEKITGRAAKLWISEYHCCVRSRLGSILGEEKDVWWHAEANEKVIEDVRSKLEETGLPFLDRYATRDRILALWSGLSRTAESNRPRIELAIILATRGQRIEARELLRLQLNESVTANPGHADYVRELAKKLGLTSLDN